MNYYRDSWHIHIAYLTVGTLPNPHDYMPHAKEFGNKINFFDGTKYLVE